jgi:Ca2+-binding EF-hand superfamily protein
MRRTDVAAVPGERPCAIPYHPPSSSKRRFIEDIRKNYALLDRDGFCAKLKGLCGPLAEHNGSLVAAKPAPTSCAAGSFLVSLPGSELVVPSKNITVVIDPNAKTQMAAEERKAIEKELAGASATASGHNRGNVSLAVCGVSSQVRSLLKSTVKHFGLRKKEGFEKLFDSFDSNGNGGIDKEEFRTGMRKIGVILSGAEIDLLWPFFDTNGSGDVDFSELMAFMNNGGKKGTAGEVERAHMRKKTLKSSTTQRRDRIVKKTSYRNAMLELRSDLKSAINKHVDSGIKSQEEVFLEFDNDGNGILDMHEVMEGLASIDILIGEAEMQILWPLLCEKGLTEITYTQWNTFLSQTDSSWDWTADHVLKHVNLPTKVRDGRRARVCLSVHVCAYVDARVLFWFG